MDKRTELMLDALSRFEDAEEAYMHFREHGECDEHYESTLQELRIDRDMAQDNIYKIERRQS